MITLQNLTKEYGKKTVLDGIDLTFREGVIYGLVGTNGCGKTTLMRCICGFTRPSGGTVVINDKTIGKDVDFAPSTGVIIEAPGFIPTFSGKRNLLTLAAISKKTDNARVDEVIRLVGLDPNDKRPVRQYSLGMRQRLGIAQAIMEDPNILMLDEPFNGLDKNAMADIRGLFQKLKAQGKIIILVSHYAQEIQDNCDVVHEIVNGKISQRDILNERNSTLFNKDEASHKQWEAAYPSPRIMHEAIVETLQQIREQTQEKIESKP